MTPLQLTIASVAGAAAGVWSWLSERRRIRAACAEGYSAGWEACEVHRRAHVPDVDPDRMFDAGFECGKQIAVSRLPQSDDWQRGFAFGFELASQPCAKCSPQKQERAN